MSNLRFCMILQNMVGKHHRFRMFAVSELHIQLRVSKKERGITERQGCFNAHLLNESSFPQDEDLLRKNSWSSKIGFLRCRCNQLVLWNLFETAWSWLQPRLGIRSWFSRHILFTVFSILLMVALMNQGHGGPRSVQFQIKNTSIFWNNSSTSSLIAFWARSKCLHHAMKGTDPLGINIVRYCKPFHGTAWWTGVFSAAFDVRCFPCVCIGFWNTSTSTLALHGFTQKWM